MSTTINPLMNGGPDDDGLGPKFPSSTGKGMLGGDSELMRLRESSPKFPNPKVKAKKFIKAAEGKTSKDKKKVKKSAKPENLRASESKSKKKGIFGEVYTKPKGSSDNKGLRVAE